MQRRNARLIKMTRNLSSKIRVRSRRPSILNSRDSEAWGDRGHFCACFTLCPSPANGYTETVSERATARARLGSRRSQAGRKRELTGSSQSKGDGQRCGNAGKSVGRKRGGPFVFGRRMRLLGLYDGGGACCALSLRRPGRLADGRQGCRPYDR
jgi:hypothetical protein